MNRLSTVSSLVETKSNRGIGTFMKRYFNPLIGRSNGEYADIQKVYNASTKHIPVSNNSNPETITHTAKRLVRVKGTSSNKIEPQKASEMKMEVLNGIQSPYRNKSKLSK
jgi:hypothetical protein